MSVLRRVIQKIINSYRRRDPIQYARYIGVKAGNNCRFVDMLLCQDLVQIKMRNL